MTNLIFFIVFTAFLAFALLFLNLLLSPHSAYPAKSQTYECGFSGFLGQNRTEFSISFYIFCLVFMLLDLEILLIFPYAVSTYNNGAYGLFFVIAFLVILTIGFIYEISKGALTINSRQTGYLQDISGYSPSSNKGFWAIKNLYISLEDPTQLKDAEQIQLN